MRPPLERHRGDEERRARRLGRAALAVGSVLALAPSAFADRIDPSIPRTIVVGPPRGFSPSDRLDGRRSGLARSRLPAPPTLLWQRRLRSGVELPPLVDEGGGVVAASASELVGLDRDGKEVWRTPTGRVVSPPVATSSGQIVVVTTEGSALGLWPSGAVRFTSPLGIRGKDADVTPLAQDDGSVVIAAGRALVALDGDGFVRARATLPDRAVGGLLAGSEGTLVTTSAGTVFVWRPPAAPRQVGSFGAAPHRGAALASPRALVAVVDRRKLAVLDLRTGLVAVRSAASALGASLEGPVVAAPSGVVTLTTGTGLLLAIDATGEPVRQIPLETGASDPAAAAASAAADGKASPPLVLDPEGRIGFARASGRVGVVDEAGAVHVAIERLCASPLAAQPAGEGRMVVACADGTIAMFGE